MHFFFKPQSRDLYAEHSLGIVNRQKISERDKMMKQG